MFEAICAEGGEGIISKKADAPYRGARTRNWLKVKCIQRQEFVIVGWRRATSAAASARCCSALHEGGKLSYAGKVGTGFDTKMIDDLCERMQPLEVDEPPLEVPRAEARGAHWIKPKLVAEIAFTEFTARRRPAPPELPRPARRQAGEGGGARNAEASAEGGAEERARRRRRASDQDHQPRPGDLPRGRPDQGRPRRLLLRGRAR